MPENNTSGDSHIKIFGRIRPRKKTARYIDGRVTLDGPLPNDDPNGSPQLHFFVPKDESAGMINNQREKFGFRFDRVFDEDTKQEEVFDNVAKDVALSVLEGYNGTIFAYGQTGSGKTFTITGGAERYADRGLIPRSIQFIFKEISKRTDHTHQVHVSYLEIYNEMGYDLLDDSRDHKKLEDLPRVTLQEDEDQTIHLRNLSAQPATTEEEALNLLFVGDTNKIIAETPSNPASSRSHCLFIISVTSMKEGDDKIRRAKLHLVDLAGSERVGRTGIGGSLLKEAKYINLSLHYLEQVIVALHEKSLGKRAHIPYRNSMMTSVLRDSLGGNCKTTMIATIAVEDELIDESISTCRFAQRVALISNNAVLNEEQDPKLVIARLKRQIVQLKAELALARGEENAEEGELPEYELQRLRQSVNDYLQDSAADAGLHFTDYRKVQACFNILKNYVLENGSKGYSEASTAEIDIPRKGDDSAEIVRLKTLIAHRDNEISVLVPMINQLRDEIASGRSDRSEKGQNVTLLPPKGGMVRVADTWGVDKQADVPVGKLTSEEKTKAFEAFRESYSPTTWINEQKSLLKSKYEEAKRLGERANGYRSDIRSLKTAMTAKRELHETNRLSDPNIPEEDPEEEQLRNRVAETVDQYRVAYQQLKDLKIEIEHTQHLLETARHKMQNDFESWLLSEWKRYRAGDTKIWPPYQSHANKTATIGNVALWSSENSIQSPYEGTPEEVVRSGPDDEENQRSRQNNAIENQRTFSNADNYQTSPHSGNSFRSSSPSVMTSPSTTYTSYGSSKSSQYGSVSSKATSLASSIAGPFDSAYGINLNGNAGQNKDYIASNYGISGDRAPPSSTLSGSQNTPMRTAWSQPRPASAYVPSTSQTLSSVLPDIFIPGSAARKTGNASVDADIEAFYRAKEQLRRQS